MATIDNKALIDEIIKNNGYYENDPQVHMIVQYTNAYGNITWGVTWCNEPALRRERYLTETEYVINPKVIWKASSN
jgi:hypothetical protein